MMLMWCAVVVGESEISAWLASAGDGNLAPAQAEEAAAVIEAEGSRSKAELDWAALTAEDLKDLEFNLEQRKVWPGRAPRAGRLHRGPRVASWP